MHHFLLAGLIGVLLVGQIEAAGCVDDGKPTDEDLKFASLLRNLSVMDRPVLPHEPYNSTFFEYELRSVHLIRQTIKKTVDETKLSSPYRRWLKVIDIIADSFISGYFWRGHSMLAPFSQFEGLHVFDAPNPPFTEQTLDRIIKFFSYYNEMIQGLLMVLNEGIARGITQSRIITEQVIANINKTLNDDNDKWIIYIICSNMSAIEGNSTRIKQKCSELKKIFEDTVRPALKQLRDNLTETYLPHCRTTYGIGSWPRSGAFYSELIRFYTSLDLTADEVHEMGLAEVARIYSSMKNVAKRQKYDSPLDYARALQNNKANFFTKPEDLTNYLDNMTFNRIVPALHKVFHRQPYNKSLKIEISKSPIPKAVYVANPTGDVSFFRLNGQSLGSWIKIDLMALCLHEAYPGHHMQLTLHENLFKINKLLPGGSVFNLKRTSHPYYANPFSIPSFTASIEGWGLYSEYLGEEMGLYEDDAELFGRYSMEMLRAGRLVVDTGIHARNWTRERAIEFLANYTVEDRRLLEIALDRYAVWPGQALAYKIGEMKLVEWRRATENLLGDKFNVRDFHQVILEAGAMPLALLKEIIDEFVQKQLNANSTATMPKSAPSIWIALTVVLARLFLTN